MPTQRTYQDLLTWYRDEKRRIDEYYAPDVRIHTLNYLPTYVRGATPVGLTAELAQGVYAWGFDFSTTAPEKTVRSKMHSALRKLNQSDFAQKFGVVTHAFLWRTPGMKREGWPGEIYFMGGLFVTSPITPATGLQLGSSGRVLEQIAKTFVNEIKTEGHLTHVDFTHPHTEYVMSFLDLAAEVITSEELMRFIPQIPVTPSEPTQPQAYTIPKKWLVWGGVGLGVLLLLLLLTRHGD